MRAAFVVSIILSAFSGTFAAPAPPTLRLGNHVVPQRYSIELSVDPDRDDFSGIVTASVDVRESGRVFWVNSAPNLTITKAAVTTGGASKTARILPGGKDFAGFEFDADLPTGKASLRIEFTGKLELKSSNGLFRGKVDGVNYIYTQFEPIAARQAFPCFDEPAFKVPWQLTLEVPAQDVAVSNTPVSKEDKAANGRKRITFGETKPLPSYLVAFAVGPFDIVDAGPSGRRKTPVRIVVPKGRAAEAAYAKQVTPAILAQLEKYFDIPYPYEKLDEVAVPLFGGAMENPGLVTYADNIILSSPQADSVSRQRSYFVVAAHELAHQWFGDLVTMSWWNDTWLNESFATWMETRITDQLHPEWRTSVEDITNHLNIMRQDALASARRIRQPVESNDDIENSFDGITYIKGGAVIRMLETWMGEKAFQKGVHQHMTTHAFGSATAEDFLASLKQATNLPIAEVASTFIDQSGVPQVDVSLDCTAKSKPVVKLSQKRFLPLGSSAPQDRNWKIPVCLEYPGGRECTLLEQKEAAVPLKSAKGCPAWVDANPGLAGYYHVRYDGALLGQLLNARFSRMSIPGKVALLGDTAALTASGAVKPSEALELAARVKDAPEHELVDTALQILASIDRMVTPDLRPNRKRLIDSLFGARARQLGWAHQESDSEETRLLRGSIVSYVAEVAEDPELVASAKKLSLEWLDNHQVVGSDIAWSVLSTAAKHGDRALFDRFLEAAKKEKEQQPRQQLINALASFRQPELRREAQQLYLTGPFDGRESWSLLFAGMGEPESRRAPFDFVKANIDAVEAKAASGITGGEGNAALVQTAGGFCDEAGRAEAEAFFAERAKRYTGGPRTLAQTLESIHLCAVRVDANAADVAAYLRKF